MNECEHGSDGCYSCSGEPPDDYPCPYCEIAKLRARVRYLEDTHGEDSTL